MNGSMDRRTFIKATSAAGLGLSLPGTLSAVRGMNAPNEKIVVGVMGVNGRGSFLANTFARLEGTEVGFICDVDEAVLGKTVTEVTQWQERTPEAVKDMRRLLENPDMDALVIAAPDHWHAPAAMMALDAGKHVYLEKPSCHNPQEGEWLMAAVKKHGDRVLQVGTQQRSAPESIQAIQDIREGLIGDVYFAKAWYANARGSIGHGQEVPVPPGLDYDLWQGPAPRRPYRDNLIHYNWHWFWHWGTGEALNNGTHEVDVCRWALDVDYPVRAVSSGGRYHFDDDWEFYDTQVMSFDFEGGKTLTWEGRSCNGLSTYDRGRGATIHGTGGSILIDREGYIVYDLQNQEVKRVMRPVETQTDQMNTVGGGVGDITEDHILNFGAAVREGAALNASAETHYKSVLLCLLGNIAQHTGRTLQIDPQSGRIVGDDEAMKLWRRTYEPGWEPQV